MMAEQILDIKGDNSIGSLRCPDSVSIEFYGYLYNIFGKEYNTKGVDDGTGGFEFVDIHSQRLIGIRCGGGASYFCSKLWDSWRFTHVLHSDGLLTDPLDGTPANTKHHSNRQIQQLAHYRMGAKN